MFTAVDKEIPVGPPDIPKLLDVLKHNGVRTTLDAVLTPISAENIRAAHGLLFIVLRQRYSPKEVSLTLLTAKNIWKLLRELLHTTSNNPGGCQLPGITISATPRL